MRPGRLQTARRGARRRGLGACREVGTLKKLLTNHVLGAAKSPTRVKGPMAPAELGQDPRSRVRPLEVARESAPAPRPWGERVRPGSPARRAPPPLATRALQPRSLVEILDKFDSEVPQSKTCQQISEEDLERQADTYTGRALRLLFRSPVRNPSLAERVAKFFCVVQAELNHCNSMGALEMHEQVEQLKQSIHRVHLYSRGEDQPLPVLGPGRGSEPSAARPRARHQEDEKEAKTEETRTQPLVGPVDLPMPATNPAATSAATTTMVSVVTSSPPGTWGCLACLKPSRWSPLVPSTPTQRLNQSKPRLSALCIKTLSAKRGLLLKSRGLRSTATGPGEPLGLF
eukprot:XP_016884654.1 uncharacterized protein LOC107985532 [Homo sapiens]